jgi:hypothetical protein
MSPSLLGGLVAVGVVVVIAMIMRNSQSPDSAAPAMPRAPEPGYGREPDLDEADDDEDGDDAGDEGHVVAVTTEGHALIPDKRVVRLMRPEESGEEWKVGAGIKSSTLRAERALGMTWSAGDLCGVRVVKGGAEEGAWVLETLGRDGEFVPFDFETRDAADAAKRLFEGQGIVRLGEDEDGNPMPPSAEQFDEARRMYHETVAELGMDDGEEPR